MAERILYLTAHEIEKLLEQDEAVIRSTGSAGSYRALVDFVADNGHKETVIYEGDVIIRNDAGRRQR